MPSKVIPYFHYWHFNQTDILHSKWIPAFHDGFITPVNLYSNMYCTWFLFMHDTPHIFLAYTEFTIIHLNLMNFETSTNFCST
jgi:hypothetical protein